MTDIPLVVGRGGRHLRASAGRHVGRFPLPTNCWARGLARSTNQRSTGLAVSEQEVRLAYAAGTCTGSWIATASEKPERPPHPRRERLGRLAPLVGRAAGRRGSRGRLVGDGDGDGGAVAPEVWRYVVPAQQERDVLGVVHGLHLDETTGGWNSRPAR